MNRRDLLKTTLATGAAVAVGGREGARGAGHGSLPPQVRPPLRHVREPRGQGPRGPAEVRRRPGLHRLGGQRHAGAAGRGAGAGGEGDGPPRPDHGRLRGDGRLPERHVRLDEAGDPRGHPGQGEGRGRGREAGEREVDDRRPRPVRRGPRVGLPDRQRHRQPEAPGRGPRAGRARDGARAAEPVEGPPRPVPHEGPAGLPDLPRGGEPLLQDPVRHVPPADHRGEHHPEHRPRVGRDRLLPAGRQPGPQGAHHRRDELPEHLPAHPRQGLHRRPRHGARISKPGIEGEKALLEAYRLRLSAPEGDSRPGEPHVAQLLALRRAKHRPDQTASIAATL